MLFSLCCCLLFSMVACGNENSDASSSVEGKPNFEDKTDEVKEIAQNLKPHYHYLIDLYMRSEFIVPDYAMDSAVSKPTDEALQSVEADGTIFYPVLNEYPKTLAELKELTERTVTPDCAARMFYDRIPRTLREIDNRLYIALTDMGGQLPGLPPDAIMVLEYTDTTIIYMGTYGSSFRDEDPLHGKVVLVKEKTENDWRIDAVTVY